MVVPSYTVPVRSIKQEIKSLVFSLMIRAVLWFMNAKSGLMMHSAIQGWIFLQSLPTLNWDGLVWDTAMEPLLPLFHQSCMLLCQNADGIMAPNLLLSTIGMLALYPLTLLELVFARKIGFTSARVFRTVYGAK